MNKLIEHIARWKHASKTINPQSNVMLWVRGYLFGLNHAAVMAFRSGNTARNAIPKCTHRPLNASHVEANMKTAKTELSCADLNRAIAHEIFGQTDKVFINPIGDKLIHWYYKEAYLGIGPEPPGNWSRSIKEAFDLLSHRCWTLYTCDDGYGCRIHSAPERGEELLGEGVSDSPMKAICIAVLEANRREFEATRADHQKLQKKAGK